MSHAARLREAALYYSQKMGLPIFPVYEPKPDGSCPCKLGKGCANIGKHPRTEHGFKDATRKLTVIKAWWDKWPTANIGIPTGNGFVVSDIDDQVGLRRLLKSQGKLPRTVKVNTSQGVHYWYSGNGIKNHVLKGADGETIGSVRSDGNYVVAPPSLHASGITYEFADGSTPWERRRKLAAYPKEIMKPPEKKTERTGPTVRLTERYIAGALLDASRKLRRAEPDSRHDTLVTEAYNLGQLVGAGVLSAAQVEEELCEACVDNGLIDEGRHAEVVRTIRDGIDEGKSEPRPTGKVDASRFLDGAAFILDAPEISPLWGKGSKILWQSGEPLIIAGPQGVGKTSIMQQLSLRRIGIGGARFLGFPAESESLRVLYLALDRPAQIARSWKRMVNC